MSGSCRETFPIVQEWWESLIDVQELSGGPTGSLGVPPGCPGVVGRPSWMSLRGTRPSRMSSSGRKSLPNVWEWSGVSPGCP